MAGKPGRSGGHAKPAALKLLNGNPGKRPINDDVKPPISRAVPPPPSHLDATGRREWNRLAPMLHKLGILTAADTGALAGYCSAWARYVEAERGLKRHAAAVRAAQKEKPEAEPNQGTKVRRDPVSSSVLLEASARGADTAHPLIIISRQSLAEAMRIAVEFGLTPSSRSRLTTAKPDPDEDEFDAFLDRANLPTKGR